MTKGKSQCQIRIIETLPIARDVMLAELRSSARRKERGGAGGEKFGAILEKSVSQEQEKPPDYYVCFGGWLATTHLVNLGPWFHIGQ